MNLRCVHISNEKTKQNKSKTETQTSERIHKRNHVQYISKQKDNKQCIYGM